MNLWKGSSLLLAFALLLTGCMTNAPQNSKMEEPAVQVSGWEESEAFAPTLRPDSSPYTINYAQAAAETGVKQVEIHIQTMEQNLGGKTMERWVYTDPTGKLYPAGLPIVLMKGQEVEVKVVNHTSENTNIHWHGLSLPNDQDGPEVLIEKNGGEFTYRFTPDYTGTYWYHSHNRPVRDQVDYGMYAPFIILDPTDQQYTIDQILVLDDWVVNRRQGHMQIEGDVDTVNGFSGDEIDPLVIRHGDKAKLRFIQASTAKNTTLTFPFEVWVTHTDGMPLETPYFTKTLSFAPGERYDVEVILTDKEDKIYTITNERNAGMRIPVEYIAHEPASSPAYSGGMAAPLQIDVTALSTKPDIEVVMSQKMARGMGHMWTINGEVFPYAEEFTLEQGKVYVIRFYNDSPMFNHPMHIHGSHFRVLSRNGKTVEEVIWKDTLNIPPGEYADVAIRFSRTGDWMLHCHILDHEDGGMMTTIHVE